MPTVTGQAIVRVLFIVLFTVLTGLGMLVVAAPAGLTATELLVDGNFESGIVANWTPSPGTTIFTVTRSPVYSGTWAASVSSNSNSTKSIAQNIEGIVSGNSYILSGYAYKNDPNGITFTVRLRLAWYSTTDCSNAQASTDDSNELTGDQSNFVFLTTGPIVAPPGAQCAQVRAQVSPVKNKAATAYFDDLTFTLNSPPTPTPTLTLSPTPTVTPTATSTSTVTVTPTLTVTPTPTPTITVTPTPTVTVTPTPVPTSTANPGDVVINEVVTDPQQDWSGNDFNGIPGAGNVTQGTDEFIELYIKADALNLTGWTIDLLDGTDVAGDLSDSGAFQISNYVGVGSFSRTVAGDYLVLGNVAGSGAMNNDILIILKDALGTMIDRVEIGSDPEGDGTDDGAPDGTGNGNATGPNDEAIARSPNGADSDDDVYDFTAQSVTMGSVNIPPPAITHGVVINEVAWGGTGASSADEWIELTNITTQTISLDGWSLASGSGSLHIVLNGQIPPGGYFLLERTDDNAITDVSADQIYTGGLHNNGASLVLKSGHTTVDSVNSDGGAWPAGNASPHYDSMERNDPLLPGADSNWTSNDRVHRNGLDADGNPVNGTPGQANSTTYPPPPPPTYLPVILNEILPAPGGTDWDGDGEANSRDEWIELFNPNPSPVDLKGWSLRDASGKTYTLQEDALIPSGQYLVIYRRVSDIALNNNGDSISLYRPDGVLADEIVYDDDPGDDISICRHPDTGELYTYCLPMPNAPNIILPPPGPLDLSIYDAKRVTEGAWVKVRGYVTVPPGVFGKNVMYIQDNTHGIRLKLPSKHGLYFDLGTRLEVTGYLDLYDNEWEIDLKSKGDARRLEETKLIPPLPIGGGLLREGYEGLLVQLTVTPVAFKKGSTHIWAEDSTGLAYIYIYRGTGIKRRDVTLGAPMTVVGIAGQRTKSEPPLDGYRLYPRYPFDIIQHPVAPPVVPDNWPTVLPETGGGVGLSKYRK